MTIRISTYLVDMYVWKARYSKEGVTVVSAHPYIHRHSPAFGKCDARTFGKGDALRKEQSPRSQVVPRFQGLKEGCCRIT